MLYLRTYALGYCDSVLIVTLVFTLALIPAWIMGRKVTWSFHAEKQQRTVIGLRVDDRITNTGKGC